MSQFTALSKSIVWIFPLLFLSKPVLAHDIIYGLVLSSTDNSPLTGAVIHVEETNQYTISDEFGKFELSIETHNVDICVSFLGYKTVSTEVSQHDERIVIILEPAPLALDQVSIGANTINSITTINKIDVELKNLPVEN